MKLPINASTFFESIKSESKQLIQLGLWDIKMAHLDSWLNQFINDDDQFFAACILEQLIFRTRLQFESGLRSLIRSNLHGKFSCNTTDSDLLEKLKIKDIDPKLRLVPVISDIDPPTKSGPFVMRRLQRILQLKEDWICWPWQASEYLDNGSINTVVFVDDFLGSGNQFKSFFEKWKFDTYLTPDTKYFYASVVAHTDGLTFLTKNVPNVQVVVAEMLEDSHSFFSENVWDRLGNGVVTAADAKKWYIDFCTARQIIPPKIDILGYNKMALTFGFSHSTPNNSLPILWYKSENWQPLLER